MCHVVSQLRSVEALVTGHLVLGVEVARLLPALVYHIVVDVRVVRCKQKIVKIHVIAMSTSNDMYITYTQDDLW